MPADAAVPIQPYAAASMRPGLKAPDALPAQTEAEIEWEELQ